MNAQLHLRCNHCILLPPTSFSSSHTFSVLNCSNENRIIGLGRLGLKERILADRRVSRRKNSCRLGIRASAGVWDGWMPEKSSKAPPLSDIIWPSAGRVLSLTNLFRYVDKINHLFTYYKIGAFAAMAMLGKIDQILAAKGISMTIAPLGAVCAVLFATPASPGARVNFHISYYLFFHLIYFD